MSSPRAPVCGDLVQSVVEAISRAEDTDPTDLDPVYEVIDPDALNELFDGKRGNAGKVEFRYHGYDVTVRSDGRVTLGNSDGP